jgi:hypothetical protein
MILVITEAAMTEREPSDRVDITVPEVSGKEAADATDLVEHLVEKYKISTVDADALFNAMVSIFIRGRMVYGDRQPAVCSLATSCSPQGGEEKN